MKRVQSFRFWAALAASLVLAACASQQEPAKKLLADVESAVTTAGADAQQYVPDQVASVTQKLGDLKAAFDKQDYKAVIEGGPALLTEARALADAAAAKKKEVMDALNAQWSTFSTTLPQSVAAAEARVAALAKGKKLPAGVTKDAVASAKSGLEEAKAAWIEASTAFGSGNVQAAVDKAKSAKAKLDEIAVKLGMSGDAAKPAG
ncbi:MAG TPA: hypothetical protein VN787_04375 [Steroidobacteraceae bacterium]|nr:hypothetical protein [Steroidobacteraceae bacterium]